jgi:hypothetical protein
VVGYFVLGGVKVSLVQSWSVVIFSHCDTSPRFGLNMAETLLVSSEERSRLIETAFEGEFD